MLPRGWVEAPLLEIVELHDTRRVPLNQAERAKRPGIYPYFGANGQVDTVGDYLFDGEYILLAEDGGYFDQPSRGVSYEVSGRFWVNNHAHILSSRGSVPHRFLSYLFNHMDWLPYVSGTTRLKLTQGGMERIAIRLPPIIEQRRIVSKLDIVSSQIYRARNELFRASKSAENLRMTALRQSVTGVLTEAWRNRRGGLETVDEVLRRFPPPRQGRGGREATDKIIPGRGALSVNHPGSALPLGWQWVPLLRIAKQETGHTPSRSQPSYWDGGVPWVGIRDAGAHHGRRIDETAQTISDEGLANSSARLLPAGTVCLSRTASVGYVTILGRPMATSQDFATWTCSGALLPEYLMLALLAEGDDIRKFGMGSTHTTIYFPEIRALHIALPPLEEQHEIIACTEAAFARADRLKAEAARANMLLDRLKPSILAKAFRGELLPQDPADEPASMLLERIRAERAGASAPKRRGRPRAPALP